MVPVCIFLEICSQVLRVFCGTEKALNQSRKKLGAFVHSLVS